MITNHLSSITGACGLLSTSLTWYLGVPALTCQQCVTRSHGNVPQKIFIEVNHMLRSLMFHGRSFCMHHFYVFVSTNDPLSSSSPYFVQQRGLAHPPPPSLIRLHQIIQAQGKSMADLVFVSVLFRRLEHETTTSD